jgi:hypothetical protein
VLVDKVAVVGADEGLGDPPGLEERLTRGSEVDSVRFIAERAPPEVVEVGRVPALCVYGSTWLANRLVGVGRPVSD